MNWGNITIFIYLVLLGKAFCTCNDIDLIIHNSGYINLATFERTINQNPQCYKQLGEALCKVSQKCMYNQFVLLRSLSTFDDFKNHRSSIYGNTAMHFAVIYDCRIILEHILIDNTFASLKNNKGFTAYQIAKIHRNLAMIKLFQDYQDEYIKRETLKILNNLDEGRNYAISEYRKITLKPKKIVSAEQILQNFQNLIERKKDEFIKDKKYENYSKLQIFINKYVQDTDRLGVIFRKLCGAKNGEFKQHIELMVESKNFMLFRDETSSNKFNAIDWAHNRKKDEIVSLLKLCGCKHSVTYKSFIKKKLKDIKQKSKPLFQKSPIMEKANISEDKKTAEDFFLFANQAKKCMYLPEDERKKFSIHLLLLSVKYGTHANIVLLDELGLLDFIKNKKNKHNFNMLLSLAEQSRDSSMKKNLLKTFPNISL
ncbi:MAG: ankyrin repeat domain-containing protein [Legionellales bacterium]|nr:ankyrin repeat domain-containing protein [Legionellales bacterium]